jgi:aminotransferase
VISLGVGEPDFVTPWKIRESAIYSIEQGYTSYTSNTGDPELRNEVSRYLAANWGCEYDPKTEIMITVGVSEALDIVLRAILEPGDEAVVTDPCYVSYAPLIALTGAKPVFVPLDPETGFGLDPETLRRAITPKTKLVFLNFPNNPTGKALSREESAAVCDVVKDKDVLLLTDEIYGELTYDREHVSLASFPDMKDRTILVHGFSKAFAMTGWRLGYVAAPNDILTGALKIHQYATLCAPIMAQKAALEALRGGIPAMSAMRSQYDQRRHLIVEGLRAAGLECPMPEGAFYVFPSIENTGLPAREFAKRLLAEGKVAVVPGGVFGSVGEKRLRCSYATSIEQLREAVDRIARFVGGIR